MTPRKARALPGHAQIGGFFGLDLGTLPTGRNLHLRSVARRWFHTNAEVLDFRNARSALVALLRHTDSIRTLWVPSYICTDVTEAVSSVAHVRYYPLAAAGAVSADAHYLAENLEPGDAVLAVDYFGRPVPPALRHLARERRDVLWIEDRAQAMWPGPAFGHAVLYSPRKLLGVADGGFLVLPAGLSRTRLAGMARSRKLPPQELFLAPLWRFEDSTGEHNGEWYAAYLRAESSMPIGPEHAMRLTSEILARIDFLEVSRRRRRNFLRLRSRLEHLVAASPVALPSTSAWVPHGYPLLVADAKETGGRMALEGVFCPNIWPNVPKQDVCGRTSRIGGRVLLLPCDHRYGPDDMDRVADVFERVLRGKRFEEV